MFVSHGGAYIVNKVIGEIYFELIYIFFYNAETREKKPEKVSAEAKKGNHSSVVHL